MPRIGVLFCLVVGFLAGCSGNDPTTPSSLQGGVIVSGTMSEEPGGLREAFRVAISFDSIDNVEDSAWSGGRKRVITTGPIRLTVTRGGSELRSLAMSLEGGSLTLSHAQPFDGPGRLDGKIDGPTWGRVVWASLFEGGRGRDGYPDFGGGAEIGASQFVLTGRLEGAPRRFDLLGAELRILGTDALIHIRE